MRRLGALGSLLLVLALQAAPAAAGEEDSAGGVRTLGRLERGDFDAPFRPQAPEAAEAIRRFRATCAHPDALTLAGQGTDGWSGPVYGVGMYLIGDAYGTPVDAAREPYPETCPRCATSDAAPAHGGIRLLRVRES